ncbi:sensor histidine kinase [Desulfobulbus alkaliphilus]|uniref:sensor histidine kinase n=1 Tax=Desulfobulbus alkaliphilus TaxID=869814 RepID=UPI001962E4AB|nr:ATP-binding protein [Desulfobulbus alkaliphilus]MBM9536978.1 HAMP domain-containing protein [Desulfobulbus alkaliphilus]
MRFAFINSLRTSLIVLVLLAVLPALAIVLYTGYGLRSSVVADAEQHALRQVQAMAAHHERVVENARLLLMTLARTVEIRQLDVTACKVLLSDVLTGHSAYVALSLTDVRGRVLMSVPVDDFADISDKPYFRAAMDTLMFTVGEYTLLEDQHRVIVQFAQPVIDGDGNPVGMLVAAFDLNFFGQLFADNRLPEHSVFTLTDAYGIRLTRFPETKKHTWVADLPAMVARMSGQEEEGTFLETGVDGISRLYGFKRLHFQGATFPYLMIRLGIPVDQALAGARQVIVRNIAFLVLAAILALITARLVGEYFIMRPLGILTTAANRLETGDLSVRTGMSAEDGELGQVSAAFDSMAEGLERKEQERCLAEAEILRLNQELEVRVEQRTEQLAAANRELEAALSDLRRTQSQLVLSEKLAALGELVAGVAHEINTPVGVALSASSALAEKNRKLADLFARGEMKRSNLTAHIEDLREGMEMILVNLNRASELIRSFKMVAADQVSETRRFFNVKKYIDEILLSLRPKLKKTRHRVKVLCDDNLDIESYPGAFSQIFTNLIINSLTHAFDAEQEGEIRIEVRRQNNSLHLLYSDNGKGMESEVLNRAFEPFFTTARGQGSTGLGMHIVFNIVTSTLGGEIRCESAPGLGTKYEVIIPNLAR